MTTEVVQFRQESSQLDLLRKEGINPNEFGREAFDREMRVFRAKKNMHEINLLRERIKKKLKGQPFFEKPVTQLIREDRDSR